MTKELKETLSDLAAVLIAVGALWKAVVELRGTLQKAGGEIWEHWVWYGVAALVLLAVLLWRRDRLVRWFVPRSTVAEREAFHIGRRYLLGRDKDIEHLLETLASSPLVFLRGESGAGKSSLLERGVLPRLKETPGLAPILIDSWGPDWVEGPREAVARAVNALLDEPLRKTLDIEGAVAPAGALRVLARLRTEAQRTPVLLFDQLDDYQTRHREKFLSGSGTGRTLLKPDELRAQNPFWNEIADLLGQGAVRCLFAIRSDAKMGLECVSFQEPTVYILDPLTRGAAAELLAIVAKTGVDHPERSFEPLAKRLLDDLSHDGLVLPIQMQGAFSGLAELTALSVGEYEKQGGLPGLQALHLKTRIAAAARAVGATPAEVRAVLLAMVNPSDPRKTEARTTDELLAALPGKDPVRLQELLDKLAMDEVVRDRIGAGGERVWQLDHDYLTGGLQELDRRDRRWQLYLEQAARSYQGARDPFERWRRMLPPFRQLRLLYESLRRRLTYGENAGYARLSAVRLLVWIAVPLAALYGWRLFDQQRTASQLFAEFGQEEMTSGELRALWSLATADWEVRRAFLGSALSEPSANAQRLLPREDSVLHAVVGFREHDRLRVRDIFRSRCLPKTERAALEPAMIEACKAVAQSLGVEPADLKRFLHLQIRDALSPEDLIQAKSMSSALSGSVGREFPSLISKKAFEMLSSYTKFNEFQVGFEFGGQVLKNLLLPPEQRKMTALGIAEMKVGNGEGWARLMSEERLLTSETQELIDSLHKNIDAGRIEQSLPLIKFLGAGVPRPDAERALTLLVLTGKPRINLGYYPDLCAILKSEEAKRILIANIMEANRFSGKSLSCLSDRLISVDAFEVWKAYSDHGHLGVVDIIFLMKRLSPSDASIAYEQALARLRAAPSLSVASQYIETFRFLRTKVPKNLTEQAESVFIDKLDAAEPGERRMWTGSLEAFRSNSAPVVRRLLTELSEPEDDKTKSLIAGLLPYAKDLSTVNARKLIKLIKRRLAQTDEVGEWIELMKSLRSHLTKQDEIELAAEILSRKDILETSTLESLQGAKLQAEPGLLDRTLTNWLNENRSWGGPACEAVVPLIQSPKDPRVLDLLKWPTCSTEAREKIIHRLDDLLPNVSFEPEGAHGEYHPDIWGNFVPWAKKEGLDIESPPKLPDLDKLQVN